ncbi:MAG: DEAD/DEAH box helicase family protein [Allosphingosinicella sp.]
MQERMHFKGVWRDYQAGVLDEIQGHLDDGRLHVVAAPGAGKTILGLETVRRLARPALVFAPTVAIREQWVQRLCPLFLEEPPPAGEVSRDLAQPGRLTLATYQALDSFRRGDALESVIQILNRLGPLTLVLDEAHHLRREWWRSLEDLASKLPDVRIVALTATPPYDSGFAEWTRYENLCGPIDYEIGIPELVRNGDLCPHQDHVILSAPTGDALALLDRRRRSIAELHGELRQDARLLDFLDRHRWLASPESCVEEILDHPEMLSASLILLASAGRELPTPPLELLGVSARDLPAPSTFWLERLLDGLLGEQASNFPIGDDWTARLRNRLHRDGLIEGGKVRLHHTQSIFRLLASSLAKLGSIADIAKAEDAALGPGLRMVILSDHIRAGEMPAHSSDEFVPAKLGVVPIFETLRRKGIAPDRLAVLTGSLVLVPRVTAEAVEAVASELGLDPDSIRASALAACPGHVRLEAGARGGADLMRLITELFSRGEIRILVGTQSLLGEGWDAPTLNSLILASNTASFMLSNQMRGRAIRIDPADPGKVANIWHLATVEQEVRLGEIAASMDWGHLHDPSSLASSDWEMLARRFRAFEGISNGPSTLIESGIGRLGIGVADGLAGANARTFELAAEREGIARRWSISLGEGLERARVRQTAAPTYAPRRLAFYDTLQALVMSGLAGGALAAANALRNVSPAQGIGAICMALAGAAFVASLPKLARAGRLVWRNGSLEGSLNEVGTVVLLALHEAGLVVDDDLRSGRFEMVSSLDGRKEIVLVGVSRSAERHVMDAVAQLLGPVQNPRYLLIRKSRLLWKKRRDYHAVPDLLGATQPIAERFAALFAARIGSSRLVYTRTPEGRLALLRARARSLAAGLQRRVDRRSAWL